MRDSPEGVPKGGSPSTKGKDRPARPLRNRQGGPGPLERESEFLRTRQGPGLPRGSRPTPSGTSREGLVLRKGSLTPSRTGREGHYSPKEVCSLRSRPVLPGGSLTPLRTGRGGRYSPRGSLLLPEQADTLGRESCSLGIGRGVRYSPRGSLLPRERASTSTRKSYSLWNRQGRSPERVSALWTLRSPLGGPDCLPNGAFGLPKAGSPPGGPGRPFANGVH
jgi:hypothetical protein